MSDIIIAAASSHGPSIQNPVENWAKYAEKDVRDPRFDYQKLLTTAKPGLDKEIVFEVQRERHAATRRALELAGEKLVAARPDVVVVVSNAHAIRPTDPRPVFGILRSAQFEIREATGVSFDPGVAGVNTDASSGGGELRTMPGHPELANHLLEGLVKEGFDVACLDALPEGAVLDEAFSFCYKWLFDNRPIPIVPFFLSRDLPNQPTANRCVDLGLALREQILACPLPLKVGIVASGGLSHQVVDEELDRLVVNSLVAGDIESLRGIERAQLNGAPGTPEVLNWLAVGAAMSPKPMTLLEYQPCYRSLAGTGHGVGIAVWE